MRTRTLNPPPPGGTRARRPPARRPGGLVARQERGAVTAEIVILTPVLLLLLLLIVQFAIWSHATHVAQAAAAQALDATRVTGGTATAGEQEARRVLDQLDTGPLATSSIRVTRTDQTASVSITGTAETIVPLLHLPVHAEATGAVERFSTP